MAYQLNLDTRTKLGLLLFANLMVFFHLPLLAELINLFFLIMLIFLSGRYRQGIVYSLIFLSCFLLEHFLVTQDSGFLVNFLGFYATTFRRLMPLFMMGSFFMATTKVSTLIYTLRRLAVPEFIVIPLSVLFRFFPTLRIDYRHIRDAMKLRGIGVTNFDLFKNPLQTLEYILVPLLMSASITATDLSAASLTRGITNPGRHTSINASNFKLADYLVLICGFVIIIVEGMVIL